MLIYEVSDKFQNRHNTENKYPKNYSLFQDKEKKNFFSYYSLIGFIPEPRENFVTAKTLFLSQVFNS